MLTFGAILLIGVFFVTSSDSGSLVMAMIASGGDIEPKNWLRVFFAVVAALLAVALLLTGGLNALKTAAITTALPFSVVLLMVCWSTVIAFNRERRAYDKAEREVLLEHVGAYYGLEVDAPEQRQSARPWDLVRRIRGGRGRSASTVGGVSTSPDAFPVHTQTVSPDPGIDATLDPAPAETSVDRPEERPGS